MKAITARKIKSPRPKDLKLEKPFYGPRIYRTCTDVPFLLIFAFFLAGMVYAFHVSIYHGYHYHLVFGTDSWGNACNRKNLPIPNVEYSGWDTTYFRYLFTYTVSSPDAPQQPHHYETVCVKECPQEKITTQLELDNFTKVTGSILCRYDGTICATPPIAATVPNLHRCTSAQFNVEDKVHGNVLYKIAFDIQMSWKQILYMCLMSVALSNFCLIMLKCFGEYIIWCIIVAVPITLYGFMAFSWYQYHALLRGHENAVKVSKPMDKPLLWLIITIILSILSILITLIIIALRKRISLISQLFKEVSSIFTDIPFLLLLQFLIFLIISGCLSLFVYIYISLESSGELVVAKETHFVHFEEETEISTFLKWYHILGSFWVLTFLSSCSNYMIATCVSIWYFTRNKQTLKNPILLTFWRLIRYHMGSVILGSLLAATLAHLRFIMEMINTCVNYKGNVASTFLMNCCSCCLWCHEKLVKFISKNAYTEMAIHGYNYCTSAKMAFYVILNNALRLVSITYVANFILFLGNLSVVTACTVVGHELLKDCDDLNYSWLPILAISIMTYFISSYFFDLYVVAIDSLFVCFCEDLLINDGVIHPYYMNKGLMTYVKNSHAMMQRTNTAVQQT